MRKLTPTLATTSCSPPPPPRNSVALFLTILVVNWAIQDGKTNYLEGAVLMMTYLVIALVTWYYPGQAALEAASLMRAATGTA